jgi:hypothetical protein
LKDPADVVALVSVNSDEREPGSDVLFDLFEGLILIGSDLDKVSQQVSGPKPAAQPISSIRPRMDVDGICSLGGNPQLKTMKTGHVRKSMSLARALSAPGARVVHS